MQLFLDWRCPTSLEPSSLPSVTSTLVQSGIKLFLHQRNQIPLPMEQMVARHEASVSTPGPGTTAMGVENVGIFVDHDNGEGEDPRDRIRRIVAQRRAKQLSNRKGRSTGRLRKLEEEGVKCINKCLMVLDNALRLNLEHFVAIGMFFGISLHAPKETIVFDLSGIQGGDNSLQTDSQASDISGILRSFYKSIIMSDEFCELTDKNLMPTRTHICFLVSKECDFRAEDIKQDERPVIMEDCAIFEDYLSQRENSSAMGLPDSSNTSCEEMNISMSSEQSPCETSISECEKGDPEQKPPQKRKKKSLYIKVTVPSVDETCMDVVDYKNLFCYQIPLRFKGIASCKNRR